jgi:beta-N-acetylhexosaminidase
VLGLGCHFLAALDGTAVAPEVVQLIEKAHVAGFTIFRRNFETVTQLHDLNRELAGRARAAGYELILAVDQEGGRVFRLPEPFSQLPPMRAYGDRYARTGDRDALFRLGQTLGAEVRAAGFNLDFAPVADIDTNPHSPIIGDRSFSADPRLAGECVQIVSCGILSQGVTTCLKHFPGHGDTTQDSHLTLPRDRRPATAIKRIDLAPYRRLIAAGLAPTIMTAHVVYPSLDPQNPATLSPTILTGLLRGELGYPGVIFSDDLLMPAIADHFGVAEGTG